MAGCASEESGVGRSIEGISSGQQQRCQAGEALAEWRYSEQVENGTPSTSPRYWDTDDEDDFGPKPSELYGKYTWKIDKFSQINKRELRSNAFEVGGYKWYILIYPQGCDVCNHLSLFLCVGNHDKLLPGWSHFAQFTIAVVNKDPKKSKYSDTLHRFWKKEHDWGWKKFMELPKVYDGFIDADTDTLIIKAQVQVIRERADRPFRCLDCQYRRELVRVYLTNVEQICRRFVEERRGKLGKLIEDKPRWSSFCAFWLGMDQNVRRRMSREKTDSILKVVVKHFFIEKEVTSTLVMDSLFSGLKALEGQTKSKKGRGKYLDAEEPSAPIVRTEKDMFVLVDDVLLLLERAAMEPLPPKEEKGPQNRMKDGGCGEDFNKDSIERDERRLTELGRRTIQIFVLAQIFSKIEVTYQEAVALKRQEELIREEEAEAWLAGGEQKAKRGVSEKEKKSKKKQGKQKRNNRKGKDRGRDETTDIILHNKPEEESARDERSEFLIEEVEPIFEKLGTVEDVSDVSDSVECAAEVLQPDSEDRDASAVNWDTETSEIHPPMEASSSVTSGISAIQNGAGGRRSPSVVDDRSSTCSTDSVPSVVMNGPYKGNSIQNQKSLKSPSRGRNHQSKSTSNSTGWASETQSQPFEAATDAGQPSDISGSCKVVESESHALQDRIEWLEKHVAKKNEEVSLQRKQHVKDEAYIERSSSEKTAGLRSPPRRSPKSPSTAIQPKSESKICAVSDPISVKRPSSEIPKQNNKTASVVISAEDRSTLRSDSHKAATPKTTENPMAQQVPVNTEKPMAQQVPVTTDKSNVRQVPVMLRPISAPVIPEPRPTAPVVTVVQATPLLARSVSAAGRLGPDPVPVPHSYIPQSYRNAIMGGSVTTSSAGFTQTHSLTSALNSSQSYSQPSTLISSPMFLPQSFERMEPNSINPGFSLGRANHDVSQNGPQWMECRQRESSRSLHSDPSPINDIQNFDLYGPVRSRSQDYFPTEFPPCTSGRQSQSVLADEFPHLDIINYLLDDQHGMGKADRENSSYHSFSNGPPRPFNRQFTFPGDIGMSGDTARFERTHSYPDNGFQHGYGSYGGHFDPPRDMISQASSQPNVNGQIDGLISNQWQMRRSDLSYLDTRNIESDGYSYHIPDYTNLACGVNGYTVFRPSNGH